MYLLPVIIAIIGNITMMVVLYRRNKKIRPHFSSLTTNLADIKKKSTKTNETLEISVMMMNANANRSKTSLRFYKLIMAQCVTIICFNIPFITYYFYIGYLKPLKSISLDLRQAQLLVTTMKLSYPLLGVYVHLLFDPDITVIFKEALDRWRKKMIVLVRSVWNRYA
ncbi:unnamed protein product [Gordionus sp. m RMFG-2023]